MEYAQDAELPVAVFVNKLDKEHSSFTKTCDAVTEAFSKKAVALTIPLGQEADVKGVIDLVRMKVIEESGGDAKISDIPADMMG